VVGQLNVLSEIEKWPFHAISLLRKSFLPPKKASRVEDAYFIQKSTWSSMTGFFFRKQEKCREATDKFKSSGHMLLQGYSLTAVQNWVLASAIRLPLLTYALQVFNVWSLNCCQ